MSEIYVFIGKAGSGKNHYAKVLQEELPGREWVNVDFKDSLIKKASAFIGKDLTFSEDYELFKQNVLGCESLTKSAAIINICPTVFTGRDLLQRLGTEVFRNTVDENFWVNEFSDRVAKLVGLGKNIYCCDCRFTNELSHFLNTFLGKAEVNVRFVHTDFKSSRYMDYSNHKSEKMAGDLCNVIKGREKEAYESSFFNDSSANILKAEFLRKFLNNEYNP